MQNTLMTSQHRPPRLTPLTVLQTAADTLVHWSDTNSMLVNQCKTKEMIVYIRMKTTDSVVVVVVVKPFNNTIDNRNCLHID